MGRIVGIAQDEAEFIKIAKGRIRKDLIKYTLRSQFRIGRAGKPVIVIPIEQIELPTFRFGFRPDDLQIGQGEGEAGDDIGPAEPGDENGEGGEKSASGEGGSGGLIEVEIEEEEYFSWLAEELKLRLLLPKGDRTIVEEREKYTSIHHIGPRSALNRPRTMKQAMKRNIATGEYDPPKKKLEFSVLPPDFRYTSSEKVKMPLNNALLIFARDYSGSVGPEENLALSKICDLIERWVRKSYPNGAFEVVYIVHGTEAFEVTRPTFFVGPKEAWGTICSTAPKKMLEIINERYPVKEWNIYPFYFSDGFNFSSDDDEFKIALLKLLDGIVNLFCYGQTQMYRPWMRNVSSSKLSPPGTIGAMIDNMIREYELKNLVHTEIEGSDDESVMKAIKDFFAEPH